MSEEGQKLAELMIVPDNVTQEQATRAMEKYQAALVALVKRECPVDPRVLGLRQESRTTQGDRAQGGGGSPDSRHFPWRSGWPLRGSEAAAAGSLTVAAYQVLKERVVPFCMAKFAANTNFAATPVQVPHQSMMYAYTAAEAKALQAKCATLTGPLSQLMTAP
jgi:hypothetical protein